MVQAGGWDRVAALGLAAGRTFQEWVVQIVSNRDSAGTEMQTRPFNVAFDVSQPQHHRALAGPCCESLFVSHWSI
jgi:hypothetical protein